MLVIYWPRANVTLFGIILSFEENVTQCQPVDLEYLVRGPDLVSTRYSQSLFDNTINY